MDQFFKGRPEVECLFTVFHEPSAMPRLDESLSRDRSIHRYLVSHSHCFKHPRTLIADNIPGLAAVESYVGFLVARQPFILYLFFLMDDNNTPATKAAISELHAIVESTNASNAVLQSLMTELAQNLSAFQKNVEQRFGKVDRRMDHIERPIDQANEPISEVLNLTSNMDHRMTETFKEHDRRIRRLERQVGLSA